MPATLRRAGAPACDERYNAVTSGLAGTHLRAHPGVLLLLRVDLALARVGAGKHACGLPQHLLAVAEPALVVAHLLDRLRVGAFERRGDVGGREIVVARKRLAHAQVAELGEHVWPLAVRALVLVQLRELGLAQLPELVRQVLALQVVEAGDRQVVGGRVVHSRLGPVVGRSTAPALEEAHGFPPRPLSWSTGAAGRG